MIQSLSDEALAGAPADLHGSESVAEGRCLFEAIPIAMLILRPDADFTIVAASDTYVTDTACVRDDVIGKSVFDVFPARVATSRQDLTAQLRASLKSVVQGRTRDVITEGYSIENPGGTSEPRFLRVRNVPVRGVDDTLLCIVHCVEFCADHATSFEESEVLAAHYRGLETALADSNAKLLRQDGDLRASTAALQTQTHDAESWRHGNDKFRLIVDALPQGIWTALPNGELDFHNRQFSDYTGAPPEAGKDGLWMNLLCPDDLPSALDAWRRSLITGEPYEATFRVRDRTGAYRWTLARALPVRDESGTIVKWIGTNTDIHEKVAAEQELRDAHRRKDEFLAMLAHELRNPLVPIGAGAEMLLMVHSEDERVSQVSEMIRRQVRHVTGLIDDLLEVSRVTQGRIALEQRTVDIKEVMHDSAEQVRPLIEAHGHRLVTHIPAEPLCVRGDHSRLVQVLSNLLSNSAKFTPDGGEITLALERRGGEAVLRVMDNGIGMESDLLRRAFDLFQQGERSAARTEGGLGLGLALVKSLVEQQRGTVSAASDGPGMGSEITVRLPLTDGTPRAKPVIGTAADTRAKSHRHRILLVDDNIDVAESVAMVLEIMGHDVVVEHDANGAIERAKHDSFDRCILDIGLPGMTGYELSRELHGIAGTRDAVFVAHTGYGQQEDRRLSSEAGFAHHLVKPAGIPDLERVLADDVPH